MKKRIAKKQMKKVLGIMAANDSIVVNCVSNSEYTGGTSIEREEDCYKSEIIYFRKRHGAPLLLKKRWNNLYQQVLS